MLMHSYSLTYNNVKLDPALSNPRASDAPVLALDPHLFDFCFFCLYHLTTIFLALGINTKRSTNMWQGRQIKHHVHSLTLAMKQVLVHEVSLESFFAGIRYKIAA